MITLSRRNSIVSGSVAAGFSLVPGSVMGANERVDVAWIGVGGAWQPVAG